MARILIAEDNAITGEMIAVRLSNEGHEILRARDGREALEQARRLRPDLILLDVMMPELDGLEVLLRLKQDPLLAAIPVVMVSARAQEQDVLMALARGAGDYVTKPFSVRELLARVNRVLAEGRDFVRVAVSSGSGTTFVGELVDGGPRSISVRFHQERAPSFAVGDRAMLSLHSASLPEPLECGVQVERRAEAEPHRIYRLRVQGGDAPGGDATDALLRLIGRRLAIRVALEPPVEVRVSTEDRGHPLEFVGALEDISPSGARFVLKGGVDRYLCCVDSFVARFRLPGSDSSFELTASIRHRQACEGGVAYGTRFDGQRSPEFLEQQEEIADFVASRSR